MSLDKYNRKPFFCPFSPGKYLCYTTSQAIYSKLEKQLNKFKIMYCNVKGLVKPYPSR